MDESKTFKIKGMHCASCASIIEKTFKKTEGVTSAEVNYGTETAKVAFNKDQITPQHLSEKIEPFGYSLILPTASEMNMSEDEHAAHTGLNQSKQEKLNELKSLKNKTLTMIPLVIISILVMSWEILGEFGILPEPSETAMTFFHHLMPIFATYALFVVGTPYLVGVYRFVRYGKANMDTLIGIGTLAAFIYSFILSAFEVVLAPYVNVEQSYYDVTIVLIGFITLGKYLEARSKLKTGDAIERLLNLQSKTALVIRNGIETEIPIQQVILGDILIIKPGSKIPVDGVIVDGHSFIDESMISGEPIPVEKQKEDKVIAGTLNTTGTFTFSATKIGSDTLLASIIRMVEDAQGSKAPIQALADKVSSVFVPIVLAISIVSFTGWIIFGTGNLGFPQALSYGLAAFVGVLVIACPCALGLATPTAIIVGVGKGAKEGILVKDASTLETLHKVTTIVLDKTGTLTKGKPELSSIQPINIDESEFLTILSSLEQRSEHPIAHAIVSYANKKGLTLHTPDKLEIIKGRGIKGELNGIEYYAGNPQLIAELEISFENTEIEKQTKQGKTPVLLATKEKLLGIAFVSDAIKDEASQAMKELHKLNIKVVMLTGDHKSTAEYIASKIGIDRVIAEVLPKDKLAEIKKLQSEGEVVAMAGDGINDAPALAQADVGIAMATGNDIAIESAGITLLHGDISKLVKAINLSNLTMRGIKQNLFWAFIYNVIGIPLATGIFYPFFGWVLNPIFAGLAMAFSSVSVVSNSLRLKNKKI